MPSEIFQYRKNDSEQRPSVWRRFNPRNVLRAIRNRGEARSANEILLGNDEILQRTETLHAFVQEKGEVLLKLSKDRYCRVRVNPNKGLENLEFRIGTKKQVASDRFSTLVDLETLVQVTFGIEGAVFTAILADLKRQAEYTVGPGEYDYNGEVYGGPTFMRGIDSVGAFTLDGPIWVPLTDEMRQNAIQTVFRPVNGIILQLTEETA